MITVFWQFFHPSAKSFPASRAASWGQGSLLMTKNKKKDKKEKTFILKHLKN